MGQNQLEIIFAYLFRSIFKEIAMVSGTGAINIGTGFDGRTVDEEYLEDISTDTPFGGGQGGEMTVIGEEEETSNDTSQPFPLPPDVFAEVPNFIITS